MSLGTSSQSTRKRRETLSPTLLCELTTARRPRSVTSGVLRVASFSGLDSAAYGTDARMRGMVTSDLALKYIYIYIPLSQGHLRLSAVFRSCKQLARSHSQYI